MINLNKLSTEKNNPNSKNIELQENYEILKRINEEDKKVAFCVEKKLGDISKLMDAIVENYKENTRIIYMGAGTSGRLGILDASECPPTYGVSPELVQGLIAGGKEAVFLSQENAEDNKEQGKKDLMDINLTKNDIVIGLAASGRTPYVIGGIEYANSLGSITGSITCSENSELVTGSTRMKSGTAQKMILNMISTNLMIKLGKVFSGYMVDVKATNKKLIERAKYIIMETTNSTYENAERALIESGNDVKVAIVMLILLVDKKTAEKKLNNYKNNISKLIHDSTNDN